MPYHPPVLILGEGSDCSNTSPPTALRNALDRADSAAYAWGSGRGAEPGCCSGGEDHGATARDGGDRRATGAAAPGAGGPGRRGRGREGHREVARPDHGGRQAIRQARRGGGLQRQQRLSRGTEGTEPTQELAD